MRAAIFSADNTTENEPIDLTESGGDAAPLLQDVGEVMFGLDGVNDLPLLIRSTIVNNVLRRADERLNIGLTQRHVADELLALVALLVERDNVTATVEDVLEFVE